MTGERFFKKHDPEGESLYPYQKLRLEMGKFVDQVCRKHGIKYTLMFATLTGALQRGGFYPNIYSIEIAMMYHDRLRFKEVFQEEVRETGYYLLDDTNFEQFEDDILLLLQYIYG